NSRERKLFFIIYFSFYYVVLLLNCVQRFGYCRRRGFLALKFNRRTNVEPCTNVQSKLFSPAFGNTLLAVRASFVSFFFSVVCVSYHTYQIRLPNSCF